MENGLYKLYPLIGQMPTWNELLDNISTSNEIGEAKKEAWKSSIRFLRNELGEGFLNTCGNNHPVFIKLRNAPYLLDDLLSFTETLRKLKHSESNYENLLGKIKPRVKCISEGICFSEIAGAFLAQDFEVKFLDISKAQKTPDIEIKSTENYDRFFIEVSQVNDSAARAQIQDEFRMISNTFLSYGFELLYSYKQLKHIGEDDILQIVKKIKDMKDAAVYNKSLEIYRDEKIDLAVAHPERNNDLLKWCKENGRDKGASGLEIDFNDTPRIVDHKKIYKKVKQIPPGKTGLLYMPIQFLYFFCMNTAETVVSIMNEIKHYPNLLGVVMYANLGQAMKEEFLEVKNTIRSVKMVNGIARHLLFVYNYNYNGDLKVETLERIKKCF